MSKMLEDVSGRTQNELLWARLSNDVNVARLLLLRHHEDVFRGREKRCEGVVTLAMEAMKRIKFKRSY